MISCGIQSGTELVVGESTPLVYSAKKPQEKFSFSLVEVPSAVVSWAGFGPAEEWIWQSLLRPELGCCLVCPDIILWFRDLAWDRSHVDLSRCTGLWLGNLVIQGLCHWETHPYKSFCSWNFSHLVETWKWWESCQIWKVSNFPNNEILCGRESCFLTYFGWICFWPFLILADFVI